MTQISLRNAKGLGCLVGLLFAWDLAWLTVPGSQTWIVAILGLPVTLFIPGALICVCLGARRPSAVAALFSVGFSVLILYVVGLGANFLPALFGVERPLDTASGWILLNVFYLALCAVAVWQKQSSAQAQAQADQAEQRPDPERRPAGDAVPWWPAATINAVAVVVPILAVLGATDLNNGGGNALALRALVLTAILAPTTYLLRHRLSDATLMTVIAAATLSLLLATSMRSWYVSGQDMQHEFQVFSLASNQGRWDVSTYRDPYNACLSVTLLPVSLSDLLRIDGAVVFKVIDQALFVTVPLALFCYGRQFLGRGGAFIVAILFIGLPTFSIDVPFITRQQIAFIFVALAVATMVIRSETWVTRRRSLIFFCMSAGVVFSHYSTAYLFIAGLLIALTLSVLSRRGALIQAGQDREGYGQLSLVPVLGASLLAVVWLGPVTHASGDFVQKVGSSASSVTQIVHDPQLVLAAMGQPNPSGDGNDLADYVRSTTVGAQAKVPDLVRSLHPVETNDPQTSVTHWLQAHLGIDVAALMSIFYYGIGTKLYLLGCAIGTVMLFVPRIRSKFGPMPLLYPIWCLSAALVLGLQVLLPSLAQDYGIARAFMQSFIVMCVPMVVSFRVIFAWWRPAAGAVLLAMTTTLLVVYSGLGPYLTGGLHRQLSLENAGPYYGTVYPSDTDIAAQNWVGQLIPAGSKVNVADFAAVYAYHPTYRYDFTNAGLFPFQVKKGNYVMLSTSQTRDHVVYTFVARDGLSIDPTVYAGSDLLYSSGAVQIFRKR